MFSPFSIPPQPSGWPIIGHDKAVALLRRSLNSDQLSHAYLFTGPPGVGKRTLALAFAMAVNCQSSAEGALPDAPCLLCASCTRIAHGAHPDVSEVNLQTQAAALGESGKGKVAPAKEVKIDTVREMQATVGLRPYSGRRRLYILGDADRLNEESSNCMLKTLEEPPSHTILVLLAPDEASVLPTISSRCLHVPLRSLPRAVVASSLVDVWEAEPEQAETLAALSGGRLGYAVTLLADRDAMDRRRAALEKVSLLMGAPISDRINAATEYAKMFTDARQDLYAMLDTWESWWRDVLVVKAAAPELASNVDQMQTLASIASRVPVKRASAAVSLVQQTRQQLLENVNPRLALEALALGLP
jgi:DNA polymerase-3 subunit delta'